ncbi:1,6-anhydro-N-acetylmuramyl-L-alanine amidase AmpD [Vreelandella malpeensis]|uniref:1,6-anhydro-N-acetylmuramyl-L-alanine amidase AmpD n=1 Tax=Vreelandella malpeensis TaxID=1172368 RepID=A0ABS8DP25_9GAMM|nr:1,6-anhydro-N-acetylmuramyl-L-alanine amidase AmpD [Halomonas malpeensis]MCB8888044.1 1,6-anhydro-N-acetylmuramyl-L-alanine amidase AmpD [Halomonas malpeensis]
MIDSNSGGYWPLARQVTSPNADARAHGEVSLLVLHAISLPPGVFSGTAIEALFTNTLDPGAHPYFERIAALRVSAHLLIRRDGECVQFVDTDRRAWHAGRSRWFDPRLNDARCALNDFSIGIELEGDGDTPFTAEQYRSLVAATRWLLARYPLLDTSRITSHAKVAPLRKEDPGPCFDWAYYRQCLARTEVTSVGK